MLFLAGCGGGDAVESATGGVSATLETAGVVETRAPAPTPTPGTLAEAVERIAEPIALDQVVFLGLDGVDWLNLLISIALVLVAYLLGAWLVRFAVGRLNGYLYDDEARVVLRRIGRLLQWLLVLAIGRIAILRLQFLSPGVKRVANDILFTAALLLLALATWHFVDLVDKEVRHRLRQQGREEELDPALTLIRRIAQVALVLVAASMLLAHFGINITALAAVLGIGGLAFSLAARDTIADAIAGMIILLDRPFRVGDRIEITAANTWGDVTDIGLRTTRILTRDNRMVIIPNSLIAKNEIINYTYPDPSFRIETHVGLDYKTDVEGARKVMRQAVQGVPSVLPDKPVDVLYSDMGESAMIFRVRWWIETYADTRRVIDQVHTALQRALDEHGIVSPYPTRSVYLHGYDPGENDGDRF